MNKTEFIAAVAAKEGLEKKTAEKAVNAVIACPIHWPTPADNRRSIHRVSAAQPATGI